MIGNIIGLLFHLLCLLSSPGEGGVMVVDNNAVSGDVKCTGA